MSNLVTLPTIPQAVQQAAQAESNLSALLSQLANELTGSIRACWESEKPQDFIDAYGTNAGKVFALHGDLVALFIKHTAILPDTAQMKPEVLSLVKPYNVSQSGAVTIKP